MKLPLKIHFLILFILTICMGLVGNMFYINELINHPQFDISIPYYTTFIGDLKNEIWYTLFFIIDFIWAPILLFFLYRIVDFILANKKLLKIIFCFFVVTYCSDFIENCLYLNFNFQLLEVIKPIKEALYALSFLIFLFVVITKHKSILIKFIKNARISLFFILIVSFLIGFVDQGGDILITLFESEVNLVVTLILIYVVAIPTTHYPVYLRHSKYMSSGNYELVMNKSFRFLSFGIIYFAKKNNNKIVGKKLVDREIFLMKFLRRCLGVLFFLSFFFMLLRAYDKAFNTEVAIPISFFLTIILFGFTWSFSKLKQKVDNSFNKRTHNKEKNKKRIERFTFIIKMTPFISIITVAFILYFLIIGVEWSKQYIGLAIITNFLLSILYIIFIVGRSYLKYVFYSEVYTKKFLDVNTESYIDEVVKENIEPSKISVFRLISQFSNNIVYLRLISIIGFLCVCALIYLNINWTAIHEVNPIPVFLMYYMGYYGILIIFIKHRKYYTQEKIQVLTTNLKNISRYKNWWKYYIPGILTAFVLVGIYVSFTGNDLHELQTLNRTEETTIAQFEESIKHKNKHYFAASYGGGLKSNLWTMLLLNKLESNKKSDFFENARCISTVSGGSVGLANYAYLKANNSKNISEKTEQLGRLNSLSLDLVFLLGRDWLSEFMPNQIIKFKGNDRSYYGMKQHLFTIDSSGTKVREKETIYATYSKIKDSFPPLIINSTSLKGRYANSLSLVLDTTLSKNYSSIFPGAINLLDSEKGRELSLYRVASTSNRFPFLSPTAKIKKKGHFLDGGIFENSGLLSAHSFANYLLSKKIIAKNDSTNNIKFVSFANSKEKYILKFIANNTNIFLYKENETPEIAGVLNAMSAIGLNPAYIKESIENEYDLVSIYLPHYFTFNDLKKVLGGFPDYTKNNLKKILLKIEENNNTIKSVLDATDYYNRDKWGIVQPATGRLLSEASVKYQKAMVNFHPDVIKQLKRLER